MARHRAFPEDRALPEDGDTGVTRLPEPATPPGTELAVGDAPLDGELVDGEPRYRAARVPVRATAGSGGADLDDEQEFEPAEPADNGRISPWVIALVAVAVLVFVGGVLWAVTGPAHNAGTTPAAGAAAGNAIQDGDTGGTTTPLPTPSSPAPRASGSTAPSTSTSPATATSSGGVPAAPSSAAPATAQVTIVSQWPPDKVQVRVVVSAGGAAVNAWSVHFSCATGSGWQLKVYNFWNAGLAANSGAVADFANASWNGHIDASSSVDFGFQATWGPADQQSQSEPACTATVTAS